MYRDEINSLQIRLSRTQVEPDTAVKVQQEQNSPNHVQIINLISVNQSYVNYVSSLAFERYENKFSILTFSPFFFRIKPSHDSLWALAGNENYMHMLSRMS